MTDVINKVRELAIFQTSDGAITLPVPIDRDTVWLNRIQLATLFERDVKTIGKHINNALREELDSTDSVVAKFATTAADGKQYQVDHYSLDMILSVGYRVRSGRGVEFRRWANKVLKDFIINGYAMNDTRLKQLGNIIKVLKRTANAIEANTILGFLDDYAQALDLLDRYDKKVILKPHGTMPIVDPLTYEECKELISTMRKTVDSQLFGSEKDESLKGVIGAIHQSFGGEDLYPTIEDKAAHLLYFTVKDHAFFDGNKRIGAAIFLYFLDKNNALYHQGEKLIDDKSLVALTILTAASLPQEKELIVRLIMNFISKKPQENEE